MKHYLLVFILLLVAVAYFLFQSQQPQRTFHTNLVNIDTAQVTALRIYSPANAGKEMAFLKQADGSWQIKTDSLQQIIDKALVQQMLHEIQAVKPKQLVSNNPEKQTEYKTREGEATRLKVQEGDKTTLDLYIGRISIKQNQTAATQSQENGSPFGNSQQPLISTYLRLHNQNDTYSADGMLGLMFNRPAKDYLPKNEQENPIETH